MVSPSYHINFVLTERDIKILSVDSNSSGLKTPWTNLSGLWL